jgi:hypothetical protein
MHRKIRFLSIPDTLLPFLTTWNKLFKQAKSPGNYHQTAGGLYESKADLNTPCVPVEPKGNRFKGQTFLLIDCRNASTNLQGINCWQFFFLNLLYSKIEIDIQLHGAPIPENARIQALNRIISSKPAGKVSL